MADIKLSCDCGSLEGIAKSITPALGTRLSCCCVDCQAFAKFLGKERDILNQYGGTDIYQMPVALLNIEKGSENLACIRLTDKGLFRWYAQCCNTPIGNTMGAGSPFIGVIHSFMQHAVSADADLGKSRGHIQLKGALQRVPKSEQGSATILFRALSKLMIWKIKGLNKPSVFFDEAGLPRAEPTIQS
jgi:hypothetical protein